MTQLLAHYTTAAGLMGIVKTGTLWATRADFLNDPEEISHAFRIARRVAESGDWSSPELRDEVLRQFGPVDGSPALPMPFIASFSEEGDLLSQWRGYPGPDGYALTFAVDPLSGLAENLGGNLASCIYLEELQEVKIAERIAAASHLFETGSPSGRDHVLWAEIVGKKFLAEVALVAPMMKRPGFSEEREHRVIVPPGAAGCHFRVARSLLIPYIELEAGPPLEVMHGPAGAEVARVGAQAFLDGFGIPLKQSAMTYRV